MGIDLLLLGGTSLDLISENRHSHKDPPKFTAYLGGSITNTAIIAAKLGLKTGLISKLGDDFLGNHAIRLLTSYGIDTSGIIKDPGIKTPIAIAKIDKSGNSIYTYYKNKPEESIIPLDFLPKNLIDSCKIFHFGSSFSYQTKTHEAAFEYVKYLKKRETFISYDPNLRSYAIKDKIEAKKRVFRLLKWADMAKLSDTDLEFLTGLNDPKKCLLKLKKIVNTEVILTLGPKGSMYLDRNGKFVTIPAFKVKIADTIGAGDAYTAGLLYKLNIIGKGQFFKDIRPNLIFAAAISAIICTESGANQGLKDIKQVNSFLWKIGTATI